MRERVLNKCDLLIRNRAIVYEAFKGEMDYLLLAGAAILTINNIEGNPDKLKELRAWVRSNTELFSEFRGFNGISLVCKMATKADPEKYFLKVKEIFKVLQGKKFTGPEDRIIAATIIADYVGDGDYMEYIERTESLYSKMEKNHYWLTNNADIPYAAALAISDRDIDQLIDDMERCYSGLKKKFGSGNALQSLSHIMAIQPEPADYKCSKVASLFDDLKAVKHSIGMSNELPTLGALLTINMSNQAIIDIITEADDCLAQGKNFGKFTMSDKTRIMFISQLLLNEYVATASTEDKVLTNTLTALTTAIESYMLNAAISAASASSAVIMN